MPTQADWKQILGRTSPTFLIIRVLAGLFGVLPWFILAIYLSLLTVNKAFTLWESGTAPQSRAKAAKIRAKKNSRQNFIRTAQHCPTELSSASVMGILQT